MPRKSAQRPALAFPPTVGYIDGARDCYLPRRQLRPLLRGASRWWQFNDMPTTVELGARRYAKSLDNFGDHKEAEQEPAFQELLREYAAYNVPRPSGDADVFHEQFRAPGVNYTCTLDLAPGLVGGWQDALSVGIHRGAHYRYDMRSAYLWAGSLGLPDVRTYRHASYIGHEPGLFRVRLERIVPNAPYPFNRTTRVMATTDEIELYSLPVAEVLTGVTWRRLVDPYPMLEAVAAVTTWKQAGRSYWGRWGQVERVSCHTRAKSWELPSLTANIPYAHLIVSRVRSKLWTHAGKGVHVFVDSVITPERLKTGDDLGDWKLEKVYPDGVQVRGPGWYGEPGKRLEKAAGVALGSSARDRWADCDPALLAG